MTGHGCVRLYQVLAPKCVARALLFGNSLALKRGARCHDLPYFSAPGAASRSLLDMLLVEGGPRGGGGKGSSRPSSASWVLGGSQVWLRHKYRLPAASAAAPAACVLSVGQDGPGGGVSSALPFQSPFSSPGLLLSVPSAAAGKQQGGPAALVPLSPPPMSRALSGSLYANKQPVSSSPILEQRQQLDTSVPPSPGGANGCTAAAAAAHAEGVAAGSDSAHGSLQSTATSASTWPVVSIPLRGLTTLWSGGGPCSDTSTAGPSASVSGITFVFASATLPRSAAKLLDGGHVAAAVAATVSAVVRQTLMAFAAAAATAAGDGCSTGGGAGGVAGYLFRESTAEMKYLLAFRSPKVSAMKLMCVLPACWFAVLIGRAGCSVAVMGVSVCCKVPWCTIIKLTCPDRMC